MFITATKDGDLTAFIGERPIPLEQVLDLTHQIAAGLESAHRAGVIHRDLKPSNVRVTPDGQVKIVDFGLSRIERPQGESSTLTTSRNRYMGTPYYMAPEHANGRTTDSRSDLFSLGVLTYELVTGKRPFTGDTPAAINLASATVDPPPMARYASHVPDELERVVRKLMAKNPDDRYQVSAHEVRTDLRRLKEEPHPVPEPRWRLWPRRAARPLAYGAAALAVAFPTQAVASIAMRVIYARRLLSRDSSSASDELIKIEDLARRTTKEIRHMLFTLRPLILESQGLVAALQDMADKLRDTYNQNVTIIADPSIPHALEMGKQAVIFYIAEEAVTNARKHAQAANIWVRLKLAEKDLVLLEIEDNGVGFNIGAVDAYYEQRGSLGLVNMRERTELVNGVLHIDSAEGQGTRIRVLIPLTSSIADTLLNNPPSLRPDPPIL